MATPQPRPRHTTGKLTIASAARQISSMLVRADPPRQRACSATAAASSASPADEATWRKPSATADVSASTVAFCHAFSSRLSGTKYGAGASSASCGVGGGCSSSGGACGSASSRGVVGAAPSAASDGGGSSTPSSLAAPPSRDLVSNDAASPSPSVGFSSSSSSSSSYGGRRTRNSAASRAACSCSESASLSATSRFTACVSAVPSEYPAATRSRSFPLSEVSAAARAAKSPAPSKSTVSAALANSAEIADSRAFELPRPTATLVARRSAPRSAGKCSAACWMRSTASRTSRYSETASSSGVAIRASVPAVGSRACASARSAISSSGGSGGSASALVPPAR